MTPSNHHSLLKRGATVLLAAILFTSLASIALVNGPPCIVKNGPWEQVGSAGFSTGQATFTSLAINPSGTPYVAYVDWSNSCKLSVMELDGTGHTGWVQVGSAGFPAEQAYFTNLV